MKPLLPSLVALLAFAPLVRLNGQQPIPEAATPTVIINTGAEPITPGKFQPTWDSLKNYQQAPEWFRDAKFGIWACFGPQSQAEDGDWYARGLYIQGSAQNKYHLAHYGPPSQFGFKDVINTWKADQFDPEKLVALYKRVGAQYFCAMANHHDNFDMWDSKYQPWNSVNVGPKKDIIGLFAQAAHDQGLRFGVTVHASHAWNWYEITQSADKTGPLAGVPYDGKLTKADGKGKWWEGLDPQDLYDQQHTPSTGYDTANAIHAQWNFTNGASIPDQAFCQKFYNRTLDLVHKYKPDLLYFDDDTLPLWPVSDAGLDIAADFYNFNATQHGGQNQGVLLNKRLSPDERQCMVWDIERGAANHIEPLPWQTDTCIGQWHYKPGVHYKTAKSVIQTLIDIVSKNGNLLLNIPVRGNGSIDDKEVAVLNGIGDWMDVNKECIFGTRPWKVFGEGPSAQGPKLDTFGMNESKVKPFTASDVRYTAKGDAIYAIVLGAPRADIQLKSLGATANLAGASIKNVALLGSPTQLQWTQNPDALTINAPQGKVSDIATVFKITVD